MYELIVAMGRTFNWFGFSTDHDVAMLRRCLRVRRKDQVRWWLTRHLAYRVDAPRTRYQITKEDFAKTRTQLDICQAIFDGDYNKAAKMLIIYYQWTDNEAWAEDIAVGFATDRPDNPYLYAIRRLNLNTESPIFNHSFIGETARIIATITSM